MDSLLTEKREGLQCTPGNFFLDPREPVAFAVVTHAHADHAVPGCGRYLCAAPSLPLLRHRLGADAVIEGVAYAEPRDVGAVRLSFHPAGHVLGSAQVRIEHEGSVWLATGDYKREPDPTCAPFTPVRCDVLVTEASYALPIFRWDDPREVIGEIYRWWERNSRRASVLFCYVLGKAQRILAGLAELTDRPVYVHGAIEPITRIYRDAGIRILPTLPVAETQKGRSFAGELVLAPITARGSTWMRRFGDAESAFASGSMRIRGQRRRRSFDRGFALSDHADWPGLLRTIEESGPRRVLATHGYREALVRYLGERGIAAAATGLAQPTDPEGD
ncbi:MAG TPA: ligase-associated DNA damage response exonuclease [Myxococcales bacterium]|nr:ligase-associated DNA damage response exonuclease [Myxococcales bacterium]